MIAHALTRPIRTVRAACDRFCGVVDEPLLMLVGGEGEWRLGQFRFAVTILLLIPAAWRVILHPEMVIHQIGLGITIAACCIATGLLIYHRFGAYRRWLGFVSSAVDVSFISFALALIAMVDHPLTALNAKWTFELYFLAISAAALRYDLRLCLSAGSLAILQYGAIVAASAYSWDLRLEAELDPGRGGFSLLDQLVRIVFLGVATGLGAALVRRSQKLLVQSNLDKVTGVGNRHYFEAAALAEVARATRHGRPCTVAVIDVDHFKRFNESHGHLAGDRVLRTLADTLKLHTRTTDVVARWGGEEFVLIFPDACGKHTAGKLERLRAAIEQMELGLPGVRGPHQVTASIGVASLPEDGHDVTTLFRHADMRMLVAKARGRNQVVMAMTSEEFDREMTRRRRLTPKEGWPVTQLIELDPRL